MTKKKKPDLSQKVMKEIHDNHIKMRPRIYFIAGSALLGIGFVAALAVSVFFVNLVFFHFRVGASFGFLKFGRLGLLPFIKHIPWKLLLAAICGIVGGAYFLKKYDFSYKKSFLGLLIALISAIIAVGFIFDRVGFNNQLRRSKPLRPLYQQRFLDKEWLIGKVIDIKGVEALVETPSGKQVKVITTKQTHFPLGKDFNIGDDVRVIGEWKDDTSTISAEIFVARGIGKARHLKEMRDHMKIMMDHRSMN